MRTRIIRRTGVVLAIATTALSFNAAVPTSGPVGAPSAEAANCTTATIGGKRKCIARGQFCAARYQSAYRRHGYRCMRDGKGRYRLR